MIYFLKALEVLYIFFIPGYFLACVAMGPLSALVRFFVAWTIGLTLIPILAFGSAVLFKTVITLQLLMGVATVVIIIVLVVKNKVTQY